MIQNELIAFLVLRGRFVTALCFKLQNNYVIYYSIRNYAVPPHRYAMYYL